MRWEGNITINRSSRVVLNPLTDIGVRVFMAVRVSRGQLVVDLLGHSKRRQAEHGTDDPYHHS